jgi:hypothetical protein
MVTGEPFAAGEEPKPAFVAQSSGCSSDSCQIAAGQKDSSSAPMPKDRFAAALQRAARVSRCQHAACKPTRNTTSRAVWAGSQSNRRGIPAILRLHGSATGPRARAGARARCGVGARASCARIYTRTCTRGTGCINHCGGRYTTAAQSRVWNRSWHTDGRDRVHTRAHEPL